MPQVGQVAQFQRYLPGQPVGVKGQENNPTVGVGLYTEPLVQGRAGQPVSVVRPVRAITRSSED